VHRFQDGTFSEANILYCYFSGEYINVCVHRFQDGMIRKCCPFLYFYGDEYMVMNVGKMYLDGINFCRDFIELPISPEELINFRFS
jgi:hypothetical protein